MKKGGIIALVLLVGAVPVSGLAYLVVAQISNHTNSTQIQEETSDGIKFSKDNYTYRPKTYNQLDFTVPDKIKNEATAYYSFDLNYNTAEASVEWKKTGTFSNIYRPFIYSKHPGSVTLNVRFNNKRTKYDSKDIKITFSNPNNYVTSFYKADGVTLIEEFAVNGDTKITIPTSDEESFIGWSNGKDFIDKDVKDLYLVDSTKYFEVLDRKGSKGLEYSTNDNKVTITGYSGVDYDVVIPTYIEGKPVTEIGKEAFCEKGITSIRIPVFVNRLGKSAFNSCQFQHCYFDKGSYLQTIEDYAFYKATNLKNVLFGSRLNYLGSNSLDIANSDLIIGFESPNDNGIHYNPFVFGLKQTYEIVYNVQQFVEKDKTNHYEYLLYNNETTGIIKYFNESINERLTLDKVDDINVSRVIRRAFEGSDIKEVAFGESMVSIWKDAFKNCKQLNKIDFSNAVSLKYINNYAFEGCSEIENIDLRGAQNLDTISEGAFKNCSKVKYVFLPAKLSKIESNVFVGMDHVMIFYEGNDNLRVSSNWADDDRSYYNNISEYVDVDTTSTYRYAINNLGCAIILDYFKTEQEIIDLTTVDGHTITGIGAHAFESCNMKVVRIPDTVKFISKYAFNGCNRLNKIEFKGESKLEKIGNYAFQRCIELKNIVLSKSLKSIGSYAFNECKNLSILFGAMDGSNINFADNWNNHKFNYFYSAKQLYYKEFNEHGGYYYFETYQGNLKFLKWNGLVDNEGPTQDLVIDEINGKKFVEICKGAFENRKLNTSAFANNTKKSITITIGDSIKVIGDFAFAHMFEATVNGHGEPNVSFQVKFSDNSSLQVIGENAFCSVKLRGNIIIPKTVNEIRDNAFGYSTYLPSKTIWMCANNDTNIKLGSYWNANQEVVWGSDWHYNESHNPVKNS